ncbi:uncharacterized protein LOC100822292 isoform X2 [Brachypodium distachyon]|uniref:uncharacterized protein LOC100822292 isoform X2 n=1 Tax=Brachypodium distachyon TaxID=15368 RepID=UPI000530058F|nr:uncharacterized protein LOC100822292 isoform X2 [Brachypodium distachyon]|eukprot:XP_010240791.1 uncharacterized protein LOC100822292 isoform X2 [Brachypodium distachyon]
MLAHTTRRVAEAGGGCRASLWRRWCHVRVSPRKTDPGRYSLRANVGFGTPCAAQHQIRPGATPSSYSSMCHGVGADAAGYEHGEPPTRRDRCRLASAVRREMEEDQSFVDMLSFGGTLQLPCSPLEKQEVPATQESSAVVKAKFTKGKHWSRDEDKVDAVIGTDQQSSLYWGRISEYYNTNKNSSWPERNPNAINCRWNTIREQTNKFCGYFQQIINRNCSGQTTDQKLCTYLFNSIVKFYVLCGSFTYHNFLCSKPRHIFCTRPKILKALLFTFFLRIRRISLHRVRVTSFRRSQQEVCQLVLAQEVCQLVLAKAARS